MGIVGKHPMIIIIDARKYITWLSDHSRSPVKSADSNHRMVAGDLILEE